MENREYIRGDRDRSPTPTPALSQLRTQVVIRANDSRSAEEVGSAQVLQLPRRSPPRAPKQVAPAPNLPNTLPQLPKRIGFVLSTTYVRDYIGGLVEQLELCQNFLFWPGQCRAPPKMAPRLRIYSSPI